MRRALVSVALILAGVAVGVAIGLYAWRVPRSYRDCVLTYVKSGMGNEVARMIRDTCKERYPQPPWWLKYEQEPTQDKPVEDWEKAFDDLIPKK